MMTPACSLMLNKRLLRLQVLQNTSLQKKNNRNCGWLVEQRQTQQRAACVWTPRTGTKVTLQRSCFGCAGRHCDVITVNLAATTLNCTAWRQPAYRLFFPTFSPPFNPACSFSSREPALDVPTMWEKINTRSNNFCITSRKQHSNTTNHSFFGVYVFHMFRIIYHCKMTVGHMGNERCSSRVWLCERSVVVLLYSALYCRTPH